MIVPCLSVTVSRTTCHPTTPEHILRSLPKYIEMIQDLADAEFSAKDTINDWPEHWEATAGAIEVWKCLPASDERLYVFPRGSFDLTK